MHTNLLDKIIDSRYAGLPKRVYHYTSVNGLMGIVDDKNIWASDIRYLNDYEEIGDFVQFIYYEICTKMHNDDKYKLFLEYLLAILEKASEVGYAMFVVSFSEEDDLLSQWRGYCPDNKGVSIGFSPQILANLVENQSYLFGKCIYDNEEKRKIAKEVLNGIIDMAKSKGVTLEESSGGLDGEVKEFLEDVIPYIMKIAALVKNDNFSAENEWRAVSEVFTNYSDMPKSMPVKFREGGIGLVPYIELKLTNETNISLPIDFVTIGPSQNSKLLRAAVSRYLFSKGISPTCIRSTIPYRA